MNDKRALRVVQTVCCGACRHIEKRHWIGSQLREAMVVAHQAKRHGFHIMILT